MKCPYCGEEMQLGCIQCRDGVYWSEKERVIAALNIGGGKSIKLNEKSQSVDLLVERLRRLGSARSARKLSLSIKFQFIGGMKVGEPSADGRGSAPPELAEQQARAGSEAAPATPPL